MNENSNQRRVGIVLTYFTFALKMIIQLLFVPVMLRILGQNEYGVYQLVASIISYLSLLNFGLGASYLKFYSDRKENRELVGELNFLYIIVFSILALIACAFGLIIAENIHVIIGDKFSVEEVQLSGILMRILAVNLGINFIGSVFTGIITAHERFIFAKSLNLLSTLLNPSLMMLGLYLGYHSIGLVCATTVVTILNTTINILFCFRKLKIPILVTKINKRLVFSIFSFSSFIFINSIVDQINWNVDKYLLGRMVGAASIAVYSIAAEINTVYCSVSDVIASIYAPKVNVLLSNGNRPMKEINDLFFHVGKLQAIIVYGILPAFVIVGREFITLWAGADYTDAYYITLLLIIPVSVPLCETLGIDIQRAMNLHKFRSFVYLGIAIANIFISIPLIKLYGGIGAAAGTTISLIIGNIIIMNIFYTKRMGLNVGVFWRNISKIIIPVIISSFVLIGMKNVIYINNWIKLFICIIVYVLTFGFALYFFYFNKEECRRLFHIR